MATEDAYLRGARRAKGANMATRRGDHVTGAITLDEIRDNREQVAGWP